MSTNLHSPKSPNSPKTRRRAAPAPGMTAERARWRAVSKFCFRVSRQGTAPAFFLAFAIVLLWPVQVRTLTPPALCVAVAALPVLLLEVLYRLALLCERKGYEA